MAYFLIVLLMFLGGICTTFAQIVDMNGSNIPTMDVLMKNLDVSGTKSLPFNRGVPGMIVDSYIATGIYNSGTVIAIRIGDSYVIGDKLPDTSLAREKDVLDRINVLRHQLKLKPFIYDPKLSAIARDYAKMMRQTKRFDHKDANGRDARYRISQAKYASRLSWRGEVIAQSINGQEAFVMLVSSPGHRSILFSTGSTGYNLIGIGNWKGNTVGLFFYNPKTQLRRITFDIPKIQTGYTADQAQKISSYPVTKSSVVSDISF